VRGRARTFEKRKHPEGKAVEQNGLGGRVTPPAVVGFHDPGSSGDFPSTRGIHHKAPNRRIGDRPGGHVLFHSSERNREPMTNREVSAKKFEILRVVKSIEDFWLTIVKRPRNGGSHA
jgi:hypothetical protein